MSASQNRDDPNSSSSLSTGEAPTKSAATAGGAQPTSGPSIEFEELKLNDQEHRIFDIAGLLRSKEFPWHKREPSSSLKPQNASLVGSTNASADLGWIYSFESSFDAGISDGSITLDFGIFSTGRVDPKLSDSVTTTNDDDLTYLALRVDWAKDDVPGHSLSPYFVVFDGTQGAESETVYKKFRLGIQGNNWALDGSDGDGSSDTDDGGKDTGTGSDKDDGGAVSEQPNSSNGDDGGNGNKPESTSGGGGGGKLSTGAIAGIAVGGAVVLIAIALLLFFFLRRRRNKAKGRGELAQSPNPSNHYIGSKEGNDGDLNSPYSEDGANITQHTPLDPNYPRSLATESPAPFTQYRDAAGDQSNLARAGTNTSISTHSHSHSPVESGSRGLPERSDTAMSSNHRVAHLVEEGMTEEDIRRLEEEERQLDVEIERAGRR